MRIGSTSWNGNKRNVTVHRPLAGESSEVLGRLLQLHTSFGSRRPSTTTLSQSTSPYCATALPAEHARAPSGLIGSPVLLRGTLYLVVCIHDPTHRVLAVLGGKLLRTQSYSRVTKNNKCSRHVAWLYAISIHDLHLLFLLARALCKHVMWEHQPLSSPHLLPSFPPSFFWGGVAQWLGRRSSVGGLSPICAWSMVDMWPLRG